jgi:UPF0176 protein
MVHCETMRRLVFALGVLSLVTAGCAQQQPAQQPTPSSAPSTAAAQPPPDPRPSAGGPCPYLETSFVADANGQHVSKVQTSSERPHPSCFFYALNGKLQLTVQVYSGDPAIAGALVDTKAPVGSSNPATDPAGWNGGYESTADGAVYAVTKGENAVVVTTNQQQTVKARTVAKQAISALGF